MSVISATAVSDCPTPTVSTMTISYPAASQTRRASRVLRATPPRVVPEGEGRMKASSLPASLVMRVLSPRIDPPLRLEEGSTERTASRCPMSMRWLPRDSTKVDLPTPGGPVMPTLTAFPVSGAIRSRSASAAGRSPGRIDSTRVMARASDLLSPDRTPEASCSGREAPCSFFFPMVVRILQKEDKDTRRGATTAAEDGRGGYPRRS
jgi:hypothetical protein